MQEWLNDQFRDLRQSPLAGITRLCLASAIILLPLGHLIGTLLLLVTVLLNLHSVRLSINSLSFSLCFPLGVAYVLIVTAELISPNDLGVTLETAFNYLPLLLLPVLFSGCWRSGIDVQFVVRSVLVAVFVMLTIALIEVFVLGHPFANGGIFERIAIAPSEFALISFLYSLILASGFLINRYPMVNKIWWPLLALGIVAGLSCILLSSTRSMYIPIAVSIIIGLFAVAFSSSKRYLAPGLLVTLIFGSIALSGLPIVQDWYANGFAMIDQTMTPPRSGLFAEKFSLWISGWSMAQQSAIFGHGNIYATGIALTEFKPEAWPGFFPGQHFNNAYVDHFVLFGGLGLAGLLIVLATPLVVAGPTWFRIYAAIIVLSTSIYCVLGRFMNNDITGASLLVMWLSLLLTQSIVGTRTTRN